MNKPKKNWLELLSVAALTGAFLLLIVVNICWGNNWIDSDMAAEMIFAKLLSEEGKLFALFPATFGLEDKATLGLIAHVDTSDAASGKDVKPQIVLFDGKDIQLKNSKVLSTEIFPKLKKYIGQELIITDGTTLLGGDDKAGIAEILTAIAEIVTDNIPHGPCAGA